MANSNVLTYFPGFHDTQHACSPYERAGQWEHGGTLLDVLPTRSPSGRLTDEPTEDVDAVSDGLVRGGFVVVCSCFVWRVFVFLHQTLFFWKNNSFFDFFPRGFCKASKWATCGSLLWNVLVLFDYNIKLQCFPINIWPQFVFMVATDCIYTKYLLYINDEETILFANKTIWKKLWSEFDLFYPPSVLLTEMDQCLINLNYRLLLLHNVGNVDNIHISQPA